MFHFGINSVFHFRTKFVVWSKQAGLLVLDRAPPGLLLQREAESAPSANRGRHCSFSKGQSAPEGRIWVELCSYILLASCCGETSLNIGYQGSFSCKDVVLTIQRRSDMEISILQVFENSIGSLWFVYVIGTQAKWIYINKAYASNIFVLLSVLWVNFFIEISVSADLL